MRSVQLSVSFALLDELANLLSAGVAPEQAIRQLRSRSVPIDRTPKIQWFVRLPDLGALPSAECLAANLPSDREPTRDEVKQAISVCLGEHS